MGDDALVIIKFSALGDVIAAFPHIMAIAENSRGKKVLLVTSREAWPLFELDDRLEPILIRPRLLFGQGAIFALKKALKGTGVKAIVDLQGNSLSRKMVRIIDAPVKIGTQPDAVYTLSPPDPWHRRTGQNLHDLLKKTLELGGFPPVENGCRVPADRSDHEAVSEFVREFGLVKGRYAVLHAGSSPGWLSKRWPKESFAQVATSLEARGIRCIWVGTSVERKLNRWLADRAGIDATGRFSLRQTCLLARGALFGVSNDSGPMHLFAAARIPVYSIFGPTNHLFSHAMGQGGRVLRSNQDCSPCFKKRCPLADIPPCMAKVSPWMVVKRILGDTGT